MLTRIHTLRTNGIKINKQKLKTEIKKSLLKYYRGLDELEKKGYQSSKEYYNEQELFENLYTNFDTITLNVLREYDSGQYNLSKPFLSYAIEVTDNEDFKEILSYCYIVVTELNKIQTFYNIYRKNKCRKDDYIINIKPNLSIKNGIIDKGNVNYLTKDIIDILDYDNKSRVVHLDLRPLLLKLVLNHYEITEDIISYDIDIYRWYELIKDNKLVLNTKSGRYLQSYLTKKTISNNISNKKIDTLYVDLIFAKERQVITDYITDFERKLNNKFSIIYIDTFDIYYLIDNQNSNNLEEVNDNELQGLSIFNTVFIKLQHSFEYNEPTIEVNGNIYDFKLKEVFKE